MGMFCAYLVWPVSLAVAWLLLIAYLTVQLAVIAEFLLSLRRSRSWKLYLGVVVTSAVIGSLWTLLLRSALAFEVSLLLISPVRVLAFACRKPATEDWLDKDKFYSCGVFLSATVSLLCLGVLGVSWLLSRF